MVGYVIIAKHINAQAVGGFDYLVVVPEVFTDPLDADYVMGGIAPVDQVQYLSIEITLSE